LPERYLPRNGQFNPDHARIFSALEMPINPAAMGQADARTGDPVSLKQALATHPGRAARVVFVRQCDGLARLAGLKK
jgi:hypothetical protein